MRVAVSILPLALTGWPLLARVCAMAAEVLQRSLTDLQHEVLRVKRPQNSLIRRTCCRAPCTAYFGEGASSPTAWIPANSAAMHRLNHLPGCNAALLYEFSQGAASFVHLLHQCTDADRSLQALGSNALICWRRCWTWHALAADGQQ